MKKYEIRIVGSLSHTLVEENIYEMLAAIGILTFCIVDRPASRKAIIFRTEMTDIQKKIIVGFITAEAQRLNHPPEAIILVPVVNRFDFEDHMNTDLDGQAQELAIVQLLDEFEMTIEKVLAFETTEYQQQARQGLADLVNHNINHWLTIHHVAK